MSSSSSLTPGSIAHLHLQKDSLGHPRSTSLQIHTGPGGVSRDDKSPLTPNYKFVCDEHMEQHHHDEQTCERGGHEGHSHNMRGVFLHVMAVSLACSFVHLIGFNI